MNEELKRIEAVLDEKVRPALRSHGGELAVTVTGYGADQASAAKAASAAVQTVRPGEKCRLSFPLQAGWDFRSMPDRPQTIGIELTLANGQQKLWSGLLRREVRTVTDLPANRFDAQPNFVLNHQGQVTRLIPSAPENEPLYWKGPDDLSATVKLARKNQALQLLITVTDNVHSQPFSGVESWKDTMYR